MGCEMLSELILVDVVNVVVLMLVLCVVSVGVVM